jgi:hypothetical protein
MRMQLCNMPKMRVHRGHAIFGIACTRPVGIDISTTTPTRRLGSMQQLCTQCIAFIPSHITHQKTSMDLRIAAANDQNSAECRHVQKTLPVRSHEGPLRGEGECPAQSNATTTNSVHIHTHMTCVHTFSTKFLCTIPGEHRDTCQKHGRSL